MKLVSAVLSVFIAVAAFAAPAELDRAATAMAGTEASVTHSFTPKGFKNSQVERGTVTFGAPPMMRWSYTKPDQKLFVFDGATSWFYVPADRQVTVSSVDDAKKRELPFLLLGDAAARNRHFVVKERAQKGSIVTTLQSRNATAAIRTVTLTTDATTHQVRRIEYNDRDGNRTAFDFSGYHPQRASADVFRFTPPAGVQVIKAD
jgi:outer membrane lipoprotein carrier protein